jgi:hypothetical protein
MQKEVREERDEKPLQIWVGSMYFKKLCAIHQLIE